MINRKIREFFKTEVRIGKRSTDDIKDTDSLTDLGIMDSLTTIKLVLFLEETFNITVKPIDLSQSTFDTIFNIEEFISNQMQKKQS